MLWRVVIYRYILCGLNVESRDANWSTIFNISINRYFTIYCVWWSVLAAGMQIHAKWFKAELRIPFNVPTPKIFMQFTWNCNCNSIYIILVIVELFPWKNQFKLSVQIFFLILVGDVLRQKMCILRNFTKLQSMLMESIWFPQS